MAMRVLPKLIATAESRKVTVPSLAALIIDMSADATLPLPATVRMENLESQLPQTAMVSGLPGSGRTKLKSMSESGGNPLRERMKFPKEIRTNCPWCHKHTVHSVALYKRGKERAGSWGARRQAGRKSGYGGQKFPELIRTAKTTKKATLRLKCKECNREVMRDGIRLRKAEIAA